MVLVQMGGMMRSGGEPAQCGGKRLEAANREEKPANLALALEFYHSFQTNKRPAHYATRSPLGYLQIFDFRPLKRQDPDCGVGRRNAVFSS